MEAGGGGAGVHGGCPLARCGGWRGGPGKAEGGPGKGGGKARLSMSEFGPGESQPAYVHAPMRGGPLKLGAGIDRTAGPRLERASERSTQRADLAQPGGK